MTRDRDHAGPARGAPLLAVRDLVTSFDTESGPLVAVDGVSFEVGHGRTVGLVGESGCGKTVTALSVMRLLPLPMGRVVRGEILLDGEDLLKLPLDEMRHVRGGRIGMIFQEPMTALNPVHRIGKQLTEAFLLHQQISSGEATRLAVALLGKVGIPSPEIRFSEYPHQLSGGMRQRVVIAMALANRPSLVIADEPTTALDVTIQAQILALMQDLQREMGMSILLITHDLGVIAQTCDEVVVMYAGKVAERAPVRELFEHPRHPYTQGLLRAIPRLDHPRKTRLVTIEGSVPALEGLPPGCRFENRCPHRIDRCAVENPPLETVGTSGEAAAASGAAVAAARGEGAARGAGAAGLVEVDALHQVACFRWREIAADSAAPSAGVSAPGGAGGAGTASDGAPREIGAVSAGSDPTAAGMVTGGSASRNGGGRAPVTAPPSGRAEEPIAVAGGTARPLLEVDRLRTYFPVRGGVFLTAKAICRAVDDVSFAIAPGETLGLVGESGCGKSTLAKTVVRLLRPAGGSVRFEGTDLAPLSRRELKPYRRNIQMIFQDPADSLDSRQSVGKLLEEPFAIHGLGTADQRREWVARLLDTVGLPSRAAARFPFEFSGGQRQRIGIARAIALEPKLVLCDEPVSALDVSIQSQILNLLSDLQRELGLSYLFISHDLAVVKHISDRIAIMYLGRIVEVGGADEVYERPRHPYTRALLAAVPEPDPRRRRRFEVVEGDVPTPIDPPSGCHFHPRCPHAEERCRLEAPVLREVGPPVGPSQRIACHFDL